MLPSNFRRIIDLSCVHTSLDFGFIEVYDAPSNVPLTSTPVCLKISNTDPWQSDIPAAELNSAKLVVYDRHFEAGPNNASQTTPTANQ